MSTQQAKNFHSITIGNKNTWDDWHLVPSSRPLVAPPQAKTHMIQIPGSDNVIDLTETLASRPVYGNRSGSWEFLVINSGQVEYGSSYDEWYERYTTIMQYLHGREYDAILDDDPYYYYRGRFSVDSWNSAKGNSILTINYTVEPYKRDLYGSETRWLWDPFNFETGVIRSYKNLLVRDSLTVVYVAEVVTSVPVITCSASGMTVRHNTTTYRLNKGENVMNGMHFGVGENTLLFRGNGRVTIEAIGGIL